MREYANNNHFQVSKNKIRKSISGDGTNLLEINLETPCIKGNETEFTKTFNDFFMNLASNYCDYCEKRMIKKLSTEQRKNKNFKTHAEIMKCIITHNTERYISVVTDINHFNGYFTDYHRFSCVWNVDKGNILPYNYFLSKSGITLHDIRKEIRQNIIDSIADNTAQFGYTEKRILKYAAKLNPENYFLTDNGIAFWYQRGTLAPENDGYPTFIIKCDYYSEPLN